MTRRSPSAYPSAPDPPREPKFPYRYRGYWIHLQALATAAYWIEKDGYHVGSCADLQDGKRIIDELT